MTDMSHRAAARPAQADPAHNHITVGGHSVAARDGRLSVQMRNEHGHAAVTALSVAWLVLRKGVVAGHQEDP
jgi:hypothetical protein